MFGPRKKGFAKEVIITEFDQEYNEDRMLEESEEETSHEKVDLMDFIDGLEDDLDEANFEDMEEFIDERSEEELLADFIRERSAGALLTSKSFLKEEDEEIEATLESLKENEDLKDIITIDGSKDIYYYSDKFMSDNYAMIAMLVEDKDLERTIAEMVRWNAKTYPCPTPVYYFLNSPYYYSKDEVDVAIEQVKKDPQYEDIGELLTINNKRYLYSTIHMSEKYARALANSTEEGEYGF